MVADREEGGCERRSGSGTNDLIVGLDAPSASKAEVMKGRIRDKCGDGTEQIPVKVADLLFERIHLRAYGRDPPAAQGSDDRVHLEVGDVGLREEDRLRRHLVGAPGKHKNTS